MKKWISFLDALQHPFLIIIRLFWGISFVVAGVGKFQNVPKVAGFFTDLGIPFPEQSVYLVASVESVCGLLLALGLFSRLAPIPLIVTMIVGLLTAHGEATFNLLQDPRVFLKEEPILFLYAALIVLLFGPGKISLDYWMKRSPPSPR